MPHMLAMTASQVCNPISVLVLVIALNRLVHGRRSDDPTSWFSIQAGARWYPNKRGSSVRLLRIVLSLISASQTAARGAGWKIHMTNGGRRLHQSFPQTRHLVRDVEILTG